MVNYRVHYIFLGGAFAASLSVESIASTFAPILRRSLMLSVGAAYPNPNTLLEVVGA